ncbi:MAG: enolase C-terminal domain-like protein, partial [Gemmatimonadota bacterium]
AGCQEQGDGQGLNHLTSAHGSSLMERVLFDALGQATGRTYHQVLATNLAAVDLAALHPELSGMRPLDAIAWQPLAHIAVRHTVGLSDPIRTAEITAGQRLDDGLPQSLEEYLPAHGLRYLKIKVGGDHRADLERLRQIAAVLQAQGAEYAVTVDGNEQYTDMEGFHRLLHAMSTDPVLRPLYARVLYIEQPLDRTCALDPEMAAGIRVAAEHRPLLIDESDGDLDAFRRAISLGYTGVSSKSCKGLIKAVANQALARRLTGVGKGRYFLSGEDLMNLPVVPLHQDLTHLACLGVEHAERNGHHYVRGLDHLSPGERAGCLQRHPDLYEGTGDQAFLRVTDGRLCVGSLQCPGLGAALPLAEETMVPLAEWRFESLH